jgi:hypothetical protein
MLDDYDSEDLVRRYPLELTQDGVSCVDILLCLACEELTSNRGSCASSRRSSITSAREKAFFKFRKYRERHPEVFKNQLLFINNYRTGSFATCLSAVITLVDQHESNAVKADFYRIWGQQLRSLFPSESTFLGEATTTQEQVQEPEVLPEAFIYLDNVTRDNVKDCYYATVPTWDTFEAFKTSLQCETGTRYTKCRVRNKSSGVYTADYPCTYGGKPRWVADESSKSRKAGVSHKTDCPASIQVVMPVDLASRFGLVKRPVEGGEVTGTSAISLQIKLCHKGHTPLHPADLLNLPTDSRVVAKIEELTTLNGIKINQMRAFIADFSMQLLAGQKWAVKHDTRFFPNESTIRNIMRTGLRKARLHQVSYFWWRHPQQRYHNNVPVVIPLNRNGRAIFLIMAATKIRPVMAIIGTEKAHFSPVQ